MRRFFSKRKSIHFEKMVLGFKVSFSEVPSRTIELFGQWSGRLSRQKLLSRMQKGDIVLASPKTLGLSLTALIYRLVLRSLYVHSMLYIGAGNMIHTTARHGVVVTKAPRKIYKKNRYAVLRVENLSAEKRERIVSEALKWEGKKLDHAGLITNVPARLLGLQKALISWEEDRIWCSKLIYQAFLAAGIELVPPEKAHVVTSEDLMHIPHVMKI
ncbi:MAG: hypothetical protein PVJ69_01430 [Desulfobacteraceae bacterium]|jgi:cell wall-associated NlpC family hydrolase